MREAIVQVVVAAKGMGKTHTSANDIIEEYILDNSKTGQKGRKVLIFDTNGEYNDAKLRDKFKVKFRAKPLALKDLQAWTTSGPVEVRRILALNDKNQITDDVDEMLEILYKILQTYRNGLLVLDDINAYLIDVSSKRVISSITRNRHRNMDILIHYQTFRAIPPRIWGNMNLLRFHKTNENISTVEAKLNNPEIHYIAQALVNFKFKTDKRFHLFVDEQEDLIFGKFSRKDFWKACITYLEENKPDILKAAENRHGKGTDSAYWQCIRELEKYYGNK